MIAPDLFVKNVVSIAALTITVLMLQACGGSSDDNDDAPSVAAVPTLNIEQIRTFRFTWNDVDNATFYRLQENLDGGSGFIPVTSDIPARTGQAFVTAPLYFRVNAQYILQSCNTKGCIDSAPVSVSGTLEQAVGYLKANNSGSGDSFGRTVNLSTSGSVLIVSAPNEQSDTTGIDQGQNDNAAGAGAVYVFVRTGVRQWSQQTFIKASNTNMGDAFGYTASLSSSGNTLVVSAIAEQSNASGIDQDQSDNSVNGAGAVYIFNRSAADTWSQQAYIKASNTGADDNFGYALSVSDDGSTLAVGSPFENSAGIGVGADQTNSGADNSGAVYVFTRNSDNVWSQQAYIKASNAQAGDTFGSAVDLSSNGSRLVVGAPGEASNAVGIDNDKTNNDASGAGAVYVFDREESTWTEQAYIKASNTEANDSFGQQVKLSSVTLVVSAPEEDSDATGIDGDQSNNNTSNAGAVYVYTYDGTDWTQQAYLKASNTNPNTPPTGDLFGQAISLSNNGSVLAVGAKYELNDAVGVGGEERNFSPASDPLNAGAAYVFIRSGTVWSQLAYVKASNTEKDDGFAVSVGLSGDGGTLVVGAEGEDSGATGVNGDQSDNSVQDAGSVYLY